MRRTVGYTMELDFDIDNTLYQYAKIQGDVANLYEFMVDVDTHHDICTVVIVEVLHIDRNRNETTN